MKVSFGFFEFFPLLSTFIPAFFSIYYDFSKKWQDYVIAVLGITFLFFTYIFFTDEFNTVHSVHSLFDIRYNKISIFIALLYSGSLFVGLFPLRSTISLSSSFLFFIAGGLGIILANNLPTFFFFWTFQRFIPLKKFLKEGKGGTYFFQHLMTFVCFLGLMIYANSENLLITPMTDYPTSFFKWPVLLLSFIIIYQSHGIFPFHTWIHDMVGKIPWYEFSAIFLCRSGVLLFVQLLLPTLKYDPDFFKILLLSLSIFSSVYWSLRGILESHLNKKTTYFYIAQASLLLTGMQADLTATKGSYLHMLVISIAGTGIFSILNYVQNSYSFKRKSQYYGLSLYFPKLSTLFCLFGLCVIGVPLGASFVVEDLVITGLLAYHQYLGLGHILATCLNGILFFLLFSQIFLGPTPFGDAPINKDMKFLQMVPYLMALIILLLIGIIPGLFLERINW
jgi:NADH:ubiquinone oxidoreductase subunit 4 (subunit M)